MRTRIAVAALVLVVAVLSFGAGEAVKAKKYAFLSDAMNKPVEMVEADRVAAGLAFDFGDFPVAVPNQSKAYGKLLVKSMSVTVDAAAIRWKAVAVLAPGVSISEVDEKAVNSMGNWSRQYAVRPFSGAPSSVEALSIAVAQAIDGRVLLNGSTIWETTPGDGKKITLPGSTGVR